MYAQPPVPSFCVVPLRTAGRWLAVTVLGLLATRAEPVRAESKAISHYTVVSGDSLWGIAQSYGCQVGDLRRANALGEGPLLVGTRLAIPSCDAKGTKRGQAREHQVKAGETLSEIAQRHGTTVTQLRALNDLDGDLIRVGQRLALGDDADELTIRVIAGQSRGRPQRGSLVDGVQLPHSPQYYRRRPEWVFGAQHVIDHTRSVIRQVNRKHPRVHRLAIGDISAPDGGVLPGHGSHQSGLDIDLGLYFRSVPEGYPAEFVKADEGKLDAAATWTMVYALYSASKTAGGPDKVFLDYDVQGLIYKAARQAGVSRSTLSKIFQYPDGRWAKERFVKHEPKHDDHLHVRFKCPPRDEGCQ